MPPTHLLTKKQCETAPPQKKPYKLADGEGMYLEVMPMAVAIGDSNIALMVRKSAWRLGFIQV